MKSIADHARHGALSAAGLKYSAVPRVLFRRDREEGDSMPLMDENHDHDWLAHGVAETAGSFFDVAFDEWGIFAILAVVVFLFVSVLGFLFAGESFQSLRLK